MGAVLEIQEKFEFQPVDPVGGVLDGVAVGGGDAVVGGEPLAEEDRSTVAGELDILRSQRQGLLGFPAAASDESQPVAPFLAVLHCAVNRLGFPVSRPDVIEKHIPLEDESSPIVNNTPPANTAVRWSSKIQTREAPVKDEPGQARDFEIDIRVIADSGKKSRRVVGSAAADGEVGEEPIGPKDAGLQTEELLDLSRSLLRDRLAGHQQSPHRLARKTQTATPPVPQAVADVVVKTGELDAIAADHRFLWRSSL